MSLFSEMSMAIVRAIAIYEHVSSSDQCLPGAIHGTFTMNAKTISGERLRCSITFRAKDLQCIVNRFDRAPAEGRNSADAAKTEVKRKAERFRTNSGVYSNGSSPHLVCARFW